MKGTGISEDAGIQGSASLEVGALNDVVAEVDIEKVLLKTVGHSGIRILRDKYLNGHQKAVRTLRSSRSVPKARGGRRRPTWEESEDMLARMIDKIGQELIKAGYIELNPSLVDEDEALLDAAFLSLAAC